MCTCHPLKGLITFDQKSKEHFAKNLPQLMKMRQTIQYYQNKNSHSWQIQLFNSKPDLIFYNGTIYTMEDQYPLVQAVAVYQGRICNLGNQEFIMKLRGPKTRLIDLKQRTLLPGFVQPHIHMCASSMKNWVQLSPFLYKNTDEIKNIILQTVGVCEEQWVLFNLYDPMITSGYLDVGRKALDQISTTKPIFILQANGHVAHVNSRAFEVMGITKESPDPEHGRYIRDYNGQLTGELQQTAVTQFAKKFPKLTGPDYTKNFERFLSFASTKGCTTLHDCGIGLLGTNEDLHVLLDTFKDPTPVRYSGYLVTTHWDQWMKLKMKPNFRDSQLRINGAKCWVDGSTQAGSAYLRDPYLKPEWGNGTPNYEQEALNKSVLQAHKKGFQVGIHANGDAGIDMALKAIQHANKVQNKPHLRHRLQHTTVCHKSQLQKMKQLHVSPSFLIGHVYYFGAVFRDKILGQTRANMIDPIKTANQCGLITSIHSDFNCQPIDPIRCIYNAVTRIMKQNQQVLNQEQCIKPYEAVKAITINAAWQCHMDDIVGSLKRGKFADFVILDRDPMKVPPTDIINISIWQTWKGGEKWYQGQVQAQKK